MMSAQKLMAVLPVFLMLSSVLIMVGFLSQFTSYKFAGTVSSLLGYLLFGWERAVNVMVLRRRRMMFKEVKEPTNYELIDNLVVLIGSILFCMGSVSVTISIIMGANSTTASFIWVGVAGCSVTLIAGAAKMVSYTCIGTNNMTE